MINKFMDLVRTEAIRVIEAMIGGSCYISLKEQLKTDFLAHREEPAVLIKVILYKNDVSESLGSFFICIPVPLCVALTDLMMGAEDSGRDIHDDDLDDIKEVFSNILSEVKNTFFLQNELGLKVEYVKHIQDVELYLNDSITFIYDVRICRINSTFKFILDENFVNAINLPVSMKPKERVIKKDEIKSSDEIFNLIKTVKLPVKVRIGKKKMLLKDVLSIDIGSIVELDQLVNSPLEILVGDQVIGLGEAVIIDGNFGIQITEIGLPKDILNKLRG